MGLPPPPRTPAQFRFPGVGVSVFDFPRLCRRRRGRARSLSPESARVAQNATPVSGLCKPFPCAIPAREQRPVRMSAETGLSPKCRLGGSGDSVHESPLSKPTTSGTACQADIPVERNDYAFAIVQPDADLTACACTSGHCVAPPDPFLRSIYRQGGRCVWVTRACLPYARTCASVIAEVLTSAWLMIFA
jgi:hypothetical protein